MKKTLLEATGLELEIPENFHFHDDGLVKNIDSHFYQLCKKYGIRGTSAPYNPLQPFTFTPPLSSLV